MTGSREFIRGNLTLEAISLTQQKLNNNIIDELANKGVLLRLFRDANLFLSIISKIRSESTDFEPMSVWSQDEEIGVIYKNWEIPIIGISEEGIDSLATLIIPYINYTVVYENGNENDIDFYDSQYNLKQTSHFEVKNQTLFLKVSVYIEKYFDSEVLVVPNARILIDFKNPFKVAK